MHALPRQATGSTLLGLGHRDDGIATLLLMCDGRDLGLAFGQGEEAQAETRPIGGRTALPDQLGDEPRFTVRCARGGHGPRLAALRHAP